MSHTDDVRTVIDKALATLDLDQKARLLSGQDMWSLPAIPEIGLDSIVMSDGPIGVRGTRWTGDPAIALPSPTGQAASWDTDLAEKSGRLIAQEARRKGVHVQLAPTINLHRSPLGGRHFEGHSEDPLLTGEMAAAFIRGVQSGGVATTAKHYVANDAETERMTVDNLVDERTLRELYLAPFETAVVKGRAWGVMAAYNGVNGHTMTEHAELQNGVLRGEWGFDGFIVSDWTASRDTAGSALGGTDVAMPGPATVYGEPLAAAVRDGRVPEATVDELVRHVLLLAARVGALAGAPPAVTALPAPVDGPAHAREVATRSFVLAKNDGELLPFDGVGRVALIGMNATDPRVMGGGSAQVYVPHIPAPADAIREALGPDVAVTVDLGTDARDRLPALTGDATLTAVARDADGTVLHTEDLPEGRVAWLGEIPEGLDTTRLATVAITGTYTPAVSGAHVFTTSGVGPFHLTVGGEEVFDGVLALPPGADIVQMFMAPPERRFTAELTAGVPVDIELKTTVDPAAFAGPIPMVVFTLGHTEPQPAPDTAITRAVSAAIDADVAVVFVNTTESVESEGFDRKDLRLPGRQDELVTAVAAANPRTVVVVTAGAPVEMPWAGDVSAILLTWFGGQEFAGALADVLTGAAEPGGRLPTTWPARLADAPVSRVEPADGKLPYEEGVFIGYRAWLRHGTAPAFWFGHGLGYTTWEYTDATFTPGTGDTLGTVRVRVTNTGERAGREVVQVYLEPSEADETRPARWLAGFTTVTAEPGGTADAEIEIPRRAAQVWDAAAHGWRLAEGRYAVLAARSVADPRVSTIIDVH